VTSFVFSGVRVALVLQRIIPGMLVLVIEQHEEGGLTYEHLTIKQEVMIFELSTHKQEQTWKRLYQSAACKTGIKYVDICRRACCMVEYVVADTPEFQSVT